MKTTLTLLLALASFCMQSQTLTWVDQLGGTLENVVNTMATDASGNVYTAGRFEGTMDADPGPGTLILTSVGGLDMFVTEVNSSGSLVWARQINGLNSSVYGDELFSIAVGASGSVYLTGRFSGTVDFDPGSGIFNLITLPSSEFCNPHKDIFILKLNPSGDFVWAEQVGGNGYDKVYAIALGSNESVHILGAYATLSGEPVDMDPGPGTYFLDSSFGASDFVLKLNADGTFVWAGLFSSNGGGGGQCGVRSTDIYPSSISVDGSDNLYVTGRLNGSADADPGPGTYTLAAVGGSNGFVFKWNSSGNFVWARQLTGAYCNVNDAAIDASGNVYTTGFFTGTVDFDPGTVTRNLKAPGSPGTSEIFVWKLNSSGNYMWAGQMGGNGTEEGSAIDLDGNNNI
ncbi:MAG: SBBP repeat-containing protein, partial [Saprospiraceae bacterium]